MVPCVQKVPCKGSGGQAPAAAGARKQQRSTGAAEHKAGALECRKARAIVQLGQPRHHTIGSSQNGCGFVLHYWDKLTFPNWPAALHVLLGFWVCSCSTGMAEASRVGYSFTLYCGSGAFYSPRAVAWEETPQLQHGKQLKITQFQGCLQPHK